MTNEVEMVHASNELADITESIGTYYYITMKDFERRQVKVDRRRAFKDEFTISRKFSYKKLSDSEKVLLRQGILENGNVKLLQPPSDGSLAQSVGGPKTETQDIRHFKWLVQYMDFRFYFSGFQNWKIGESYECIFVKGNKAWIKPEPSGEGRFRYYSKNYEDETVFGLNIFDLIQIRDGLSSFYDVAVTIAHDLNISVPEWDWKFKQEEKYEYNLREIKKFCIDSYQLLYPNLYKLVRRYTDILEYLVQWGSSHILDRQHTVNGDSIFFVSTTHMEQVLNRDQSVCSRAINLFAILGLIVKVPPNKVPKDLMGKAIEMRGSASTRRLINFYSIPKFDKSSAEICAEGLIKRGIRNIFQISRPKLQDLYGEEFANEIYVNPTAKEQMFEQALKSHLQSENE